MIKQVAERLPTNKILRQIARLNLLAGKPQLAYKFDDKYKALELIVLSKNNYLKTAGIAKFWKYNLPILKFHNDDLDFIVKRVRPETKDDIKNFESALVVRSTDSEPIVIKCNDKSPGRILEELVKVTNARQLKQSEIPLIEVPAERL